jgi:PhnB protein
MQSNPYLYFDGTCEEAFKFYETALGARTLVLMRNAGTPAESQIPADWKDKIIHGRIEIAGMTMLASDAPPGRYSKPQGFTIALRADTPAEADHIFAALSEGGEAGMPIAETFFAHRFGMLTDRFGTPWMVLCEKSPT